MCVFFNLWLTSIFSNKHQYYRLCVLSPVLFTLQRKFADDTTVVGLISDNDETNYREEIHHLMRWCTDNNLVLNTSKTMEVTVDYRRTRKTAHAPFFIHREEVERVDNVKFLGIHITSDLTWTLNTSHLVKKAQQRLFFLRKLKRAGLSPQLLRNFYRATVESILCLNATVWFGSCTAQDRKNLARVVRTAQRIVGSPLPDLDSLYTSRVQKKASRIAADSSHPGNRLFVPLPSRKRYRNIKTHTSRLRNSFYPRAVKCMPMSLRKIISLGYA